MFSRLFPQSVDNTFRGYKLALWCFAVIVLMRVGMSLNSIFNGYFVASSADGIPLRTFTSAGAETVVSLFAIWGLAQGQRTLNALQGKGLQSMLRYFCKKLTAFL